MRTAIYAFLILLLIGGALALSRVRGADGVEPRTDAGPIGQEPAVQGAAVATFAGGCFWCVEEVFEEVPGVVSAVSGYAGGNVKNPTYEQVSAGGTGHTEAVRVIYDPDRISYPRLLDLFWHNVDPLTPNRQFCDRGEQYRAAIFYRGDEQKRLAELSKQAIEESGRFEEPIVTEIVPATEFYEAEEYHQNYYKKNPVRYKFYKWNCGRAQRLEELWG
ncbi:peptide-methionine (S)-S-oxide reductase MsrA [soil metagenome]